MKQLLFILFVLCTLTLNAQKIKIKALCPGMANKEMTAYRYADYITKFEMKLFDVKTNEKGEFEAELRLYEPQMIYFHYGQYFAYFFAEPGKKYDLIFPPYDPKTKADELNPFFKESTVHIGVKDADRSGLNYMIATFDSEFDHIQNEIVYDKYGRPSKKGSNHIFDLSAGKKSLNVDSCFQVLKDYHQDKTTPIFEAYKQYRIGMMKISLGFEKEAKLHHDLFLGEAPLYYNPAYMTMLAEVYDDYLLATGRTEKGKGLFQHIAKSEYAKLKDLFHKEDILKSDSLIELVLLSNLYDEFYDDNFSRSAMLKLLDSLYFKTEILEHKLIAQNIREKVTKLLVGFFPPKFALHDFDGGVYSLDKFKGKYLYLGFISTYSYTCIQQLELMRHYKETFGEEMEFVMIVTDKDMFAAKRFIQRKKFPFKFLYFGEQPTVVKDYDVRAYPTYYLIGPDGRLVMSPALAPTEDLDQHLGRMFRRIKAVEEDRQNGRK